MMSTIRALPQTTNSWLRPIRGWPLGVYGLLAIWLCGVQICIRLRLMGDSALHPENFVTASFLAPLALVAMSRIDLKRRFFFFVLLLAPKIALNLATEFLAATNNPPGYFPQLPFYKFETISIRDVRDFAIAVSVAHALSCFTRTYVTSQPLPPPQALQSRIVDWLYFMTLVGLAFLPQWPEVRLTYNENKDVILSLRRVSFWSGDLLDMVLQMSPCLGAALTGQLWLTRLRDWRRKVLMLVLVAAHAFLCTTYAHFELKGSLPYSLFFGTFAVAALITTPFWILLRIAGYHVVSSGSSLFSQRSENNAPASVNS